MQENLYEGINVYLYVQSEKLYVLPTLVLGV